MKISTHIPPFARAVLAATPFLLSSVMAQSTAPATAPLGSTFYNWDTLIVTPTKSGARRAVIDSPTLSFARLTMHITTLNPGAILQPPGHHAQEEVIWVREGNLELWLNGKTQNAGPGALIFLAAHALHNLKNIGDKPATYYVIDVYTAATAIVRDQPADEWAPAGVLKSTVFDCNNLPSKPTPKGFSCPVVTSPTATLVELHSHLTTLNPGMTTGMLADPADEIIIITAGLVESNIKGITCRLAAGSFYFQAANDLHSMTNVGPTPTTYQVLKFVSETIPKPAH